MCHYFKAIFDASFRPPRSFSGKWNWFIQFVQTVNAIPGRNLPVLNFTYHLPKPWTDRFAHPDVNGKQPSLFCGLKPAITFIDHFYFQLPLKQKVSMDQVHYRGSMDLAQISGPWTRSKIGVVRGPRVSRCPQPTVLRRISAL